MARTTVATLPIGIPTRSFGLPLRRALAAAAELDADGVVLDLRNELRPAEVSQTGLRQLKKLLEDFRMGVIAAVFPTRGGLDDPDGLERRVLALREAMTLAYQLGARVVLGAAGEAHPPAEEPSATLIESLSILGAHGERCGARYAFASGADPETQRGWVERVGEGSVGVALNPALLLAGGVEPADAATLLGPHTLHLQAADAVREASATGPRSANVRLGRGEADLPAVLAVLEEHGYRGAVTAVPSGEDPPRTELADAVAYLRAL